MRKILGIGETVYDVLFKDNQPTRGIPGGSAFNTMISLGRLGLNSTLISEIGRDHIGKMILSFMEENRVNTSHIYQYYDGRSPVSLVFMDDQHQTETETYQNYPNDRLDIVWPRIDSGDLILYGSFYSLYPNIRSTLTDLLTFAKDRKAILLYDPNFRKNHESEVLRVMPAIIENLEFADLVRGSIEDFRIIYKEQDVDKIYRNHIRFYCPVFICTDGGKGICLRTPSVSKDYPVSEFVPVSPVGAGDAFNAGILYGLIRHEVTLEDLNSLTEEVWDQIVGYGIRFANNVCEQMDNYISDEFAQSIHN